MPAIPIPLLDIRSNREANDVQDQIALLERCLRTGSELSGELPSYDQLRYEFSTRWRRRGQLPRKLEDFSQRPVSIPVVSFFAGAGGLDLGLEAAGFQHAACIEVNSIFCQTLRLNRPQWQVVGPPDSTGDVSEYETVALKLERLVGKRELRRSVFVGGPPCQPFSVAANQRFSKSGDKFKRIGFKHKSHGNLLFDFVWLIEAFRPMAFLIENVLGSWRSIWPTDRSSHGFALLGRVFRASSAGSAGCSVWCATVQEESVHCRHKREAGV